MDSAKPPKKIPGFIVNIKLVKKSNLESQHNWHNNVQSLQQNQYHDGTDSEQEQTLPNKYNRYQKNNHYQVTKHYDKRPSQNIVPDRLYTQQNIVPKDTFNIINEQKKVFKNSSREKSPRQLSYKSLMPVTHPEKMKNAKINILVNPQLQQFSRPSPQQKPLSQPFIQYDFEQIKNQETFQNLQGIYLDFNDILPPEQAMSTVYELIQQHEEKQKQQLKEKLESLIPNVCEVFFTDMQLKKNTPKQFPIDSLCNTFSLLKNIDKSIRRLSLQQEAGNYNLASVFYALKKYIKSKSQKPVYNINCLKLADNKKLLLRKSIISQQTSIIIIGFCLAHQILPQNKNFILNLVKFSIDSNLFLLSQLIKSEQLSLLLKFYYPYLEKEISSNGFQFSVIKYGNDVINQIFMKMSLINSIFFGTTSLIVKQCKRQSILTTFKQLLKYLSFYINTQKLTKNSGFFSTAPSPFIQIQPVQNKQQKQQESPQLQYQKSYLILDSSDFYYKTFKKQIVLRPFTQYFLKEMDKYFVIVNLSNWTSKEANKIMSSFDPNCVIKNHCYSHHYERCVQQQQSSVTQNESTKQGETLIKNSLLFGPSPGMIYFLTTTEKLRHQRISNCPKTNIFNIDEWKYSNKSDRKLVDICPKILMQLKTNQKKTN